MRIRRLRRASVNVFNSEKGPGSLQEFFFVNHMSDLTRIPVKARRVDHDCSNVWIDYNKSKVRIRSYNRNGLIQFGGASSFGLAWYLRTVAGMEFSEVQFGEQGIGVRGDTTSSFYAEFPVYSVSSWKSELKLNFGSSQLHFDGYRSSSGVYLWEIVGNSGGSFKNALEGLSLHDLHSFPMVSPKAAAVFYWQKETEQGWLRYFVPWHGKNEDSVTGSVQSLLAPLIYQKKGCPLQKWTQCSFRPGELESRIKGSAEGTLEIRGNCRLLEEEFI